LICDRDCKTAMSVIENLLVTDPDNALANHGMETAAIQCGNLTRAFEAGILLLQKSYPLNKEDVNKIEKIFNDQGFYAAHAEIIKKLEIMAEKEYITNMEFAWRYYLINQDDKAIEWLEKAFEAHENLAYISTGLPNFTRLYNNPRFIEILNKMGLPEIKTESNN